MPLLVSLRNNFVAGGVRYRAHPDGTVIPDEWKDKLPKDAEIISELDEEAPIPPRYRRRSRTGGVPAKPSPKKAKEAETLSQMADKEVKELGAG